MGFTSGRTFFTGGGFSGGGAFGFAIGTGGGGGGAVGTDHTDSVSDDPDEPRRAKQHQNNKMTRIKPRLTPIMIPPTSSRRRPVCSVVGGAEDLRTISTLIACGVLAGCAIVDVTHEATIAEAVGVDSSPERASLTSGIDRPSGGENRSAMYYFW